jgi:hypothetical protein
MTHKEVVDILGALEEKYPVEQWTIDDIHVWPIIKMDIFYHWFNIDSPDKDNNYKPPAGPSANKLMKLPASVLGLLGLLLKSPRKAAMLFAGANSHRVEFEGGFINRYFQPMAEYLEKDLGKKSVMIDYYPKDPTKHYKADGDLLFFHKYAYAALMLHRRRTGKQMVQMQGFQDAYKNAQEKLPFLPGVQQYLKQLSAKVGQLQAYATVFNILLDKYKPEFVLNLCYYSPAMRALTYAANKKGIPVADMQHGGQGDLHPAYSRFHKVPAGGYNVMPRFFWCWDNASANVIDAWARHQSFHQVIKGGNPWLSYSIDRNRQTIETNGKKIILYTMQTNELEDYIIEAIRRLPDDYEWWLRLHPRKQDGKPAVRERLAKEGLLSKTELEKSNIYPLPQILLNANVHISRFSGSIIEAAQLGVKTIITDEIGEKNYAEYIDSKDAFAFRGRSGEELAQLIVQLERGKTERTTSIKEYQKVLSAILNN